MPFDKLRANGLRWNYAGFFQILQHRARTSKISNPLRLLMPFDKLRANGLRWNCTGFFQILQHRARTSKISDPLRLLVPFDKLRANGLRWNCTGFFQIFNIEHKLERYPIRCACSCPSTSSGRTV